MSKQLKLDYKSIDELMPYANNANIHDEEQIDQIAASIQEFGFNDPVGVWTNSQGRLEIVEGHGRVMACRKLGIQAVPVVYLDDLTDQQRRAYTHIHNQQTRNSEFDWDILNGELDELSMAFDFGELGFDVNGFDFMDFDGEGNGGGSVMANGSKVNVVIGGCYTSIEDKDGALFARTKKLQPGDVSDFIKAAIESGLME